MADIDDPIDRARTSRPQVGLVLKDRRQVPGYALIVVAVVTLAAALTAAAESAGSWAIGLGAVAAVTAIAGVAWVFVGRRRVAEIGKHRRQP